LTQEAFDRDVQEKTRWLPYAILPSRRERERPEPSLLHFQLKAGQTDWGVALVTGATAIVSGR
jgi:hypothetical protein